MRPTRRTHFQLTSLRQNDSAAFLLIAREVAKLRGIDIEKVAWVTTDNAERLFFSGCTRWAPRD